VEEEDLVAGEAIEVGVDEEDLAEEVVEIGDVVEEVDAEVDLVDLEEERR